MSDFISKSRLKWEVEKWYENEYYSSFNAAVYKKLIKIIDKFPSVEPERKTGKWRHMVGFWECDQCHAEYTDMPTCMGKVIYEYCPMCGAKMEVQNGTR